MKSEERIRKRIKELQKELNKTPMYSELLDENGADLLNPEYEELDTQIVALRWVLK